MSMFQKYPQNPVLGNETTGTFFDAYVMWDGDRYRMDFSYRAKGACAVAFSEDGINWSEPLLTLEANPESGWEDQINRNCVLFVDGLYRMWYTGQARGYSYIGYAQSSDGIHFERTMTEPILIPEYPWEKESVMNPCVLYENGVYRMWYSAGETYEPNVIAYAESSDGIHWNKRRANPIFVREPQNWYEQDRIGGCSVLKTEDMGYVMFYIGYEDIDTARICAASSENGITGWVRCPENPIISPDPGQWDSEACYKPAVVWDEVNKKWMLWYNGRTKSSEYIGLAECSTRDLFGRV